MKKEEDKRLIIPKDTFEEEASEGLGKLNKDEAAEDLRDLESRMARRLRKPIRVWIPAAAAVIIILIASTVYIGLFRERQAEAPETAMAGDTLKDTALIAMAEPVRKDEEPPSQTTIRMRQPNEAVSRDKVKAEEEAQDDHIIEIIPEEEIAEEVVVQAVPEMAKAVQAVATGMAATGKVATERTATEKAATEKAATGKAGTQRRADAVDESREVIPLSFSRDHAPQPEAGIEELNRRISNSIRYPPDVMPRTRQQVIVTFRVRPDSTIYDLKAVQTPGDRFTEEAFRLMREGPLWIPAVRNGILVEETVKVSLVFR